MSVKRIILVVIAIILVGGFITIGVLDAVKTRDQIEFQKVELKSKSTEIKELNVKYDQLNKDLEKASKEKETDQAELERLNKEREELNKQKQELEAKLQAKIQNEQSAKVASATTSVASSGSVEAIVREAAIKHGLDPDWFVRLAMCESTMNPNAVNRGYYANGHPSGLFQHISGYWAKRASDHGYAGASVFDPVANANVTASMWKSGSHLWECQ